MTGAKVVYAQSSDIKSRSFREYRRDMKKKAIAELEFLPFLQSLLKPAAVAKHGADADLWFLQKKGKLTQAPDYKAEWPDGRRMLYEFQYAESGDLKSYDFKLSKVGAKAQGKQRVPHEDREFFYVVKPSAKYAFVEPSWIMRKGREGAVPAWGNRSAYRVPVAEFDAILKDGGPDMSAVIAAVDAKNALMIFQEAFLNLEAENFSRELQRAVDEEKLVKIMPATLDGFFRVCFLLERMGKEPQNPGMWLVYLASFFKPGLPALEFARWAFAFDFLYFRAEELSGNEQSTAAKALADMRREIGARANADGSFARDPVAAPAEETRQFLFAVNVLEDIQQHFAVTYGGIGKVGRIYEVLPDFAKTADFVRGCVDH